jgi:multiple antibiotic resistance protein
MQGQTLPLVLLASLLFTLIGPIALLPTFAALTGSIDRAMQMRIALVAAATALVTFALAVFIGAGAMARAGTTPAALILAAGLILLLTALRNIFAPGQGRASRPPEAPGASLGFAPLALPGIVTPAGVAIVIIFASYFPSLSDRLAILGVIALIVTANLAAMLLSHAFMRHIGPAPLQVLGAVFGVLQAAMGIEVLLSGLARSPLGAE